MENSLTILNEGFRLPLGSIALRTCKVLKSKVFFRL